MDRDFLIHSKDCVEILVNESCAKEVMNNESEIKVKALRNDLKLLNAVCVNNNGSSNRKDEIEAKRELASKLYMYTRLILNDAKKNSVNQSVKYSMSTYSEKNKLKLFTRCITEEFLKLTRSTNNADKNLSESKIISRTTVQKCKTIA